MGFQSWNIQVLFPKNPFSECFLSKGNVYYTCKFAVCRCLDSSQMFVRCPLFFQHCFTVGSLSELWKIDFIGTYFTCFLFFFFWPRFMTYFSLLNFLFIFMAGWRCHRSLLHLFLDKMLGGEVYLVLFFTKPISYEFPVTT